MIDDIHTDEIFISERNIYRIYHRYNDNDDDYDDYNNEFAHYNIFNDFDHMVSDRNKIVNLINFFFFSMNMIYTIRK